MNRKLLNLLLSAEAVLCVLAVVAKLSASQYYSTAMAFPFEQIGLMLRALSLSGSPGNIVAISLYALISLSPLIPLVVLQKKRGLQSEDALLLLLSVLLLAVLYLMVNPGLIGSLSVGMVSLPFGKAVLGTAVYSILLGFLMLKALRLFFFSDITTLQSFLCVLLSLLAGLFIFSIFGDGFSSLLDSFANLAQNNTGAENLTITYIFLAFQYIIDAVPDTSSLIITLSALALLQLRIASPDSEEIPSAAEKLCRICGISLTVTILSNIAFNLLQLLFSGSLHVINTSLQFPLFSFIFASAMLLFSRLLAENKQLKDDNNMFI